MTPAELKRLRGLKDLVRDVVTQGASAVERVHLATARRPFQVLGRIAPLAQPAQLAHQVHDAAVSTTYGLVRAVAHGAGEVADLALDALEPGPVDGGHGAAGGPEV
jgi:hypothetical protein